MALRLILSIQDLKLVYLTVYMILHFLKDVSILTSFTPLVAPTLNYVHEMNT
jgi:hypothetical protein